MPDDQLPPELLTLMQLGPHGDSHVEPALVAKLCGWNRDKILELLRIAAQDQISWSESGREAAARGDADDADICFNEAHAWQSTIESLRQGLRLVVERGA